MRTLHFVRFALSASVASLLLASCAGSQPPIGPPVATTPAHQAAAPATGEALLYASPGLESRGQLSGFEYTSVSHHFAPEGLCTDKAGDVFVAGFIYYAGQRLSGQVYEFAHGAQTPIATLTEKYPGYGCAVDPETGDLAVSNLYSSISGHGSVAVFEKATGKPKYYVNSEAAPFIFCTYDDSGDLFLAQGELNGIAELPKGSTSFQEIQLSNHALVDSVQWNDGTLAVSSHVGQRKTPNYIYRVEVANGVGQIVGTTTLDGLFHRPAVGQFWIDGAHLTEPGHSAPRGRPERLLLWRYPAGGNPTKTVKTPAYWTGVTVSDP
jgi:hypothetical protein